MREVLAFPMLAFVMAGVFIMASAFEPDPLEQLLKTDTASLQRKALHDIANAKSVYFKDVAQRIESCYSRNGSYKELSKLLYLAALIKCKEAVPVLEKIWLDRESFGDDCIYCCPRSLVMTVLGLHKLWTPQNISENQRRAAQVEDTLYALERLPQRSPVAGSNATNYFGGSNEEAILANRFLSLTDDRLLEIVTDSKNTYDERYVASVELKSRIVDDHLLVDLYWWAMNACDDAAGECLCFAHESILAAELYNSKQNN